MPKPGTSGESLLPEERGEGSVHAKQTRVVNYSLLVLWSTKSRLYLLFEGQNELCLCLFEFK